MPRTTAAPQLKARRLVIRADHAKACLLCGKPGPVLYSGVADLLFGSPGAWSFRHCGACRLMWIDPRPRPQDIGKLYSRYFTHATETIPHFPTSLRKEIKLAILQNWLWRFLRERRTLLRLAVRVIGYIPLLGSIANPAIRAIMALPLGRHLDIGCGGGEFLAMMEAIGWEAVGIEPDSEAARTAVRQLGLEVINDTLGGAKLGSSSFDLITLNHTIEHVHDPVSFLRECRRILKPGGTLSLITPNIESFGHRAFKTAWVHLDIPRHLTLFSPDSLRACVERGGLEVTWLTTASGLALTTYRASQELRARKAGRHDARPLATWLRAFAFYVREGARRNLGRAAGEELVLVARRPGG